MQALATKWQSFVCISPSGITTH